MSEAIRGWNRAGLGLVVLAAGLGRRFGGDKQVADVGPHGEWLLEYSIYDAWQSGFTRVVLIVRPEIQAILEPRLCQRFGRSVDLRFCEQRMDDLPEGFTCPAQRRRPWGTGHAVWSARTHLDLPFCVVNADDFYGRGAFETAAEFFSEFGANPTRGCMVAYSLANTLSPSGPVSRALCIEDAGRLVDLQEVHGLRKSGDRVAAGDGERVLSGEEAISMNFFGLPAHFTQEMERSLTEFLSKFSGVENSEFYLPSAVSEAIGRGRLALEVLRTEEHSFGMTHAADLELVRAQIRHLHGLGVYPTKLRIE